MLEIIAAIFSLCLIFLGFCYLIRLVNLAFLKSDPQKAMYLLVPLDGSADDIELTLRSAESEAGFLGRNRIAGVIAVDCGLSEEAREICSCVMREHEDLTVCRPDELETIVFRRKTGAKQGKR